MSAKSWGGHGRWEGVVLGVRHVNANDGDHLVGGGDFFATPGRDLADDSLVVGTTIKAHLSETVFARLGYDCTLQSDNGATDHALSFQLGWRF